jgi:hypothetical protein
MTEYADLEIGLQRRESNSYAVSFVFSEPQSDAAIRPGQSLESRVHFDTAQLQGLLYDPEAYGKALSQSFFSDPSVYADFNQARSVSQAKGMPLRLRLLIDPSAPELHNLRWETLRDPQDDSALFQSENILFSRYLYSMNWRPVELRARGELSALVAIANPSNLAEYNLASIDEAGELERARQALEGIAVSALPDAQGKARASLEKIFTRLKQEDHDILYLVCHGAMVKRAPWLWLEDETGQVARVSGKEFIEQLKNLEKLPRLVVLASCESAGDGIGEALSALGPRLAGEGVSAVVAMLGKISIQTASRFMPVFFRELLRDGVIDRAMAEGRNAVRDQPDAWMPSLFMRLKSGRIWYVPGFSEVRFEKWPSLLRSLRRGECVPILGPGMYEKVLGSQREIARRWAEAYRYPMAPHERESLPQVAQYLTINQYERAPYDELEDYLQQAVQRHFHDVLPEELRQRSARLDDLINAIGAWQRSENPYDPYHVVAQLPLPVFITTNVNNLLASALEEVGKDPQAVLCPWNDQVEQQDSIFKREPDYRPSVERPLVYHLFGRLSEPASVVLTEDDYFRFLIGVTSNKMLFPTSVLGALASDSLLLLGLQIADWEFRVIFQSIILQEGDSLRNQHVHIAAQIEPEEGRLLEPERARRYLEGYLQDANISIYWGSVNDFMQEFAPRWLESNS